MNEKTADELEAKGRRLHKLGQPVIFLHPKQEWMAEHVQSPFLRTTMPSEDDPMTTPTEVTKEFFLKKAIDEATRPIVSHPEDHKKFLREVDERVLPRRKDETDEAYGRRMYEHLNGAALSRS